MKIIDLIQQKCKQIINDYYQNDNITFFISEMYNKGYILTLINSKDENAFEYRQSEFIELDTDLENVIELLYNRTL